MGDFPLFQPFQSFFSQLAATGRPHRRHGLRFMNRFLSLLVALTSAEHDTNLLQVALNLRKCPAIFPTCELEKEICGTGPELLKLSPWM